MRYLIRDILQAIEDSGGDPLFLTWMGEDADACKASVGAGCYLMIWQEAPKTSGQDREAENDGALER